MGPLAGDPHGLRLRLLVVPVASVAFMEPCCDHVLYTCMEDEAPGVWATVHGREVYVRAVQPCCICDIRRKDGQPPCQPLRPYWEATGNCYPRKRHPACTIEGEHAPHMVK